MIIEFLILILAAVSLTSLTIFAAYISTGGKLPKFFPSLKWKRNKEKDNNKPTTILANLLAAKILSLPLTTENSLKSDRRTNILTFRKTIKNIEIDYTQYSLNKTLLHVYAENGRTLSFSEKENKIIIEAIQKLQELIKKQEEIDRLVHTQKTATEVISDFMGVDGNDTNDK